MSAVDVMVTAPVIEVTVTGVGAQGPQGPTGPQGPQGATGATGPVGPVGPADSPTEYVTSGPGPSVTYTVINGQWKSLPTPTGFTAQPTGCAARQADGSVAVTEAGWYHVAATVRASTGDEYPSYCAMALSTSATPGEGTIGNGSGGGGSFYYASADGDVLLTAGQKVFVHAFISNWPSNDPQLAVVNLSIHAT